MKIAVLGLGYVGTVSAACLAARGHSVIGVDVAASKVEAINVGESPVIEPGLAELVRKVVADGALRAQSDAGDAISRSELSLVCVGTPGQDNGALDLVFLERVSREIGQALKTTAQHHVVAYRSTMLPGTAAGLRAILERESHKAAGSGFGLAVNPEFLREGSSLRDFDDPPRIVVGELDEASGGLVMALYDGIVAPRVRTSIEVAELVKYADNAFHAAKIAFANEIGNVAKRAGVDARALMEIFRLDTKLNLSGAYLEPGAAFGGSCLPKDVRALVHYARSRDLETPLLEALLPSNDEQKRLALELVRRAGGKRVGVLGISFKPDTDDLRESPTVELVEALIGKGYDLALYDRNVSQARLIGQNRAYIEREIPHFFRLLRESAAEVAAHAEVLVVTARDGEFAELARRLQPAQVLVDLVGVVAPGETRARYQGICW